VTAFYEPLTAHDAWFVYAERRDAPLDIGTVCVFMTTLFDSTPEGTAVEPPAERWRPRPAPGDLVLVRRQLADRLVGRHHAMPGPLTGLALWLVPWLGFLQLGRSVLTPRPRLFFNRRLGPRRTGRGLKVPLADFRALKRRLGCTINDAVLTVVAEGLHRWPKARGERVPERLRVFVPVSMRVPGVRGDAANCTSGLVFELPMGAMSMEERLRLAGRVMATPQTGANLNVTNVPGPQQPLYTGGAQLLEIWAFAPLYPSMALGLAVVSYDGDVYVGLGADPGVVPDVAAFAGRLKAAEDSCVELARAGSE
jgi:diacylglycerol O-acyltransferase / wax synthase